jgi:hypothetical protein
MSGKGSRIAKQLHELQAATAAFSGALPDSRAIRLRPEGEQYRIDIYKKKEATAAKKQAYMLSLSSKIEEGPYESDPVTQARVAVDFAYAKISNYIQTPGGSPNSQEFKTLKADLIVAETQYIRAMEYRLKSIASSSGASAATGGASAATGGASAAAGGASTAANVAEKDYVSGLDDELLEGLLGSFSGITIGTSPAAGAAAGSSGKPMNMGGGYRRRRTHRRRSAKKAHKPAKAHRKSAKKSHRHHRRSAKGRRHH